MIRRTVLVGVLALAVVVTGAWAQPTHTTGTVSRIDGRTVYFTDGRMVTLQPGSTLTLDGRVVTIDAVRPGTNLVIVTSPSSVSTTTTVLAPAAPAPAVLAPQSTIDVNGVVASVDARTGTITFQDGRMIRLTDQSLLWEPSLRSRIRPGERIFVRNALPVAFAPVMAPAATVYTPPAAVVYGGDVMGTVLRVDPSSTSIVLSDGSVVRVSPTTRLSMAGRPMTIADFRPGDEVVVRVPGGATVTPGLVTTTPGTSVIISGSDAPSALPRQAGLGTAVVIEAAEVYLMRMPESP